MSDDYNLDLDKMIRQGIKVESRKYVDKIIRSHTKDLHYSPMSYQELRMTISKEVSEILEDKLSKSHYDDMINQVIKEVITSDDFKNVLAQNIIDIIRGK